MAKQKILFTNSLFDFNKSEWDNSRYEVWFKDTPDVYTQMFNNPKYDVVWNFDDKKDPRKQATKMTIGRDVSLSFAKILNKVTPKNNFIFNQDENSLTAFRVYVSSNRAQQDIDSAENTEFTFNGNFSHFQISTAPFEIYNIKYNSLVERSKIKEGTHNWFRNREFNISCNKIKHLNIDMNGESLEFSSLHCKALETIDFKNVDHLNLPFNCCRLSSLQKMNLSNVKQISLHFSDYDFSALDFTNKYGSSSVKSEIEEFAKDINLDCDIVFSPNTEIYCYNFLPDNSNTHAGSPCFKASEIFPEQKNNKEIIVKPLELIYRMWKMKKQSHEEKFNNVEKTIQQEVQKHSKTNNINNNEKQIEKIH